MPLIPLAMGYLLLRLAGHEWEKARIYRSHVRHASAESLNNWGWALIVLGAYLAAA